MSMGGKKIPGRNDPCHCGSGKKYKQCCLHRDEEAQQQGATVMDELNESLEGENFGSLDEMQSLIDRKMESINTRAVDAFHGLNPEQMHKILHFPFTSTSMVTFADPLAGEPSAPIISLFSMLAEAIGEKGLKSTAKGNLPRNTCRQIAQDYLGEEGYEKQIHFGKINSEADWYLLHVTRLVAELSGLIRKYKGRFILSRDCRKILADNGTAGIYPRLFRGYIEKFNWGYWDGYPENHFYQGSFLFTLYLLYLYGSQELPNSFYEDAFIEAFPMILDDFEETDYSTPDESVRRCYTLRALEGFSSLFGLINLIANEPEKIIGRSYTITTTPLFNEVVRFKIATQGSGVVH